MDPNGEVNTNGRFPTEKGGKLSQAETLAWGKHAMKKSRDFQLVHGGEGDGFVYFLFQDRRGGIDDLKPIAGRVPVAILAQVMGHLATIGGSTKVMAAAKPPE